MEVMKIFSDIEGEEKLYSVLLDEEELYLFSETQKEFTGAIKKANKLRKRAWLEKQSAGGFLGIGKKSGKEAIKQARKDLFDKVSQESGYGRLQNLNQKINAKGNLIEKEINTPNPKYFYNFGKEDYELTRRYQKKKARQLRKISDLNSIQKTPYGKEAVTWGRTFDRMIGG